MKRRDSVAIALVLGLAVPSIARANLGTAWVEEVTRDSITVRWSTPSGVHQLRPGVAPRFRITCEPLTDYEYRHPAGSRDSRYTEVPTLRIGSLQPNTSYRIKVEADAEKRMGGQWMNPRFRTVAVIKQRTMNDDQRYLRIDRSTVSSIRIEFQNPGDFSEIRIAYKRKGSPERLNEVAMHASRASVAAAWQVPDSERGWKDLNRGLFSGGAEAHQQRAQVTFAGLLPDQEYEVVAYGLTVGTACGERLVSATAETDGYRSRPDPLLNLAADFQEDLKEYGRRLRSSSGVPVVHLASRCISGLVPPSEPPPESPSPEPEDPCAGLVPANQDYALDFIKFDEKENLDDDLTALLYLIRERNAGFLLWQGEGCGEPAVPTLMEYMDQEVDPNILQECREEVDEAIVPAAFQRGDVDQNGRFQVTDAIVVLSHLFQGGAAPSCRDAADATDDGKIDISDPTFLFASFFQGAGDLPDPFRSCGIDQTEDDLDCESHSCQ